MLERENNVIDTLSTEEILDVLMSAAFAYWYDNDFLDFVGEPLSKDSMERITKDINGFFFGAG